MAEAAVSFLLENLKQLLLYNAELILDANAHIEGLHKDLMLFKAFLKDSTEKRRSNTVLQALVENIRDVVHKAEDTIDKFVVEKAEYNAKGRLKKTFQALDHAATVRKIALEIKSIRGEVQQIYQQQQFGFTDLQLEEHAKPPVVEEEDVVGFDEEARTVIKRLNGEDKDLDVMTIIGMPGLGKTTLARKIYNDPEIEYEFFRRAWVYVSEKYSRREVFLSILSSFTDAKNFTGQQDENIVRELRRILDKGKYLIVMDDVWTPEAWNDLRAAFPNNMNGSRILMTSRDSGVATYANRDKPPHDLKFLTKEESWVLLQKKVFGKKKCPEGEMETQGQHIATVCKGLPLAIVVIAGILLNNRYVIDWWKQVAGNVDTFIVTDRGKFMDVIALSYNQLPYHLKSCFLYLGVFPEDHEIPVWKLIHLWMAEGFIEQNEQLSLEDIADACVVNLVNRNLLMAAKRRWNGQIKTCRVHDMLHDFCKKEAERQNFYQEIKNFDQVNSVNYRRLCIKSGVEGYFSSKPSGEHVRSFLCFPQDDITLGPEYMSTIPKAFKLLRVLDIKSVNFGMFPKEIVHLVLLRYLALSCNIKTLPSKISKLWNMQTLIFMTSKSTLELKEDIWKLYRLRHFRTNASALLPRPPHSIPKGKESVQSLSTISPESCNEHVFTKTPNIKKLGVRGKLAILFDQSFDNIAKLQDITNLKLFNDPVSHAQIVTLPPAYKFPTKLRKLTLADTALGWDQMQVLGNLEKLEVLKLKDNAFKGKIWEPKDGGFLSLKVLHIEKTDLVTWTAKKHHFPSLKRLVLKHCEKLMGVPSDFGDIISFQVLILHRSSNSIASAKEIQKKKMASGASFKFSTYPPEI